MKLKKICCFVSLLIVIYHHLCDKKIVTLFSTEWKVEGSIFSFKKKQFIYFIKEIVAHVFTNIYKVKISI